MVVKMAVALVSFEKDVVRMATTTHYGLNVFSMV